MSIYAGSGFQATLQGFADAEGLPFSGLLCEEEIDAIAREEGVHFGQGDDDVYTPGVTLWAWLSQCLCDSKSCVGAVARVLVFRVALEMQPCSAATGAFCKARAKLPEPFIRRLALLVGNRTEDQAPGDWRWHGRRVLLVDGTECSAPDTPENQKEYPQPGSQKPGLGFPLVRLVVLLAFATAGVVDYAVGPHKGKGTGETSLFLEMLGSVRQGDVLVADRCYCTWWLIALAGRKGGDVVFRLHSRRHADFRRGKRLGKEDHVVFWAKPEKPWWMTDGTYAGLPDRLETREVRFSTSRKGCRTRQAVVATTLLDASEYPKADVASLYGERWNIELDIRAIKQTLRMDVLTCKTPGMLRKEIGTHLLAYNLTRKTMAQAARAGKMKPREVSFAGAVQTLCAFRWLLVLGDESRQGVFAQALLAALRAHKVGDRPGRFEPRKVKRRPKAQRLMTRTRQKERARMARGRHD